MKVNYILKGKNNPTNIICRFKPTQQYDFSIATGIWIDRNNWNSNKQNVKQRANIKNKDLINSKLNELQTIIIDQWNTDILDKKTISKNWLRHILNDFFGRATINESYKIYFTDWIVRYIDDTDRHYHKGKPMKPQTVKNLQSVLSKLLQYENAKKTQLKHRDINLKFYYAFVSYCREVDRLGNNTIGKYISTIKKFCRLIEQDGYDIDPQYKHPEFVAITNKTKDIYLTETEINKIYNHDFSKSIRLDNTRDLFIIGLRTGLRISDFLRLKDINIAKGFIEISETTKTGEPVIIPLHQQIRAILEKHNGKLPHSIADQNFNLYIKEVCKEVGIKEPTEGAKMNPETKRKETGIYPKYELVTSHICRRSFASNLYGKLPNMVIMSITGHRTEAQFLKYIKITKKQHAETLRKHWAKEEKEQGYTNVLKIAE